MKNKLFNRNFILFLYGKFISDFGDILYSVALSYWVLKITGSKSIMGILLATQTLVRVCIAPIGGVLSDRLNRKNIMVGCDLVCGITILLISIVGFMDVLQVWMVFISGIILSICSAIFRPTDAAILPDLVDKEDLSKALSADQTTTSLTSIAGQSISGVLLSIFGPIMIFFMNGISYLIAAFTESFIKVPKRKAKKEKVSFMDDIKIGFQFVKERKVFQKIFLISAILNFFANGAFVLLLPYFLENPSLKSEMGYGWFSAAITVGSLLSFVLYGLINVKGSKKIMLLFGALVVQSLGLISFLLSKNIWFVICGGIIFGIGNAMMNVIFQNVLYLIVPEEQRGKVFGLQSTLSMGLTPLSMAVFSIAADSVGTYPMMVLGFTVTAVASFLFVLLKEIQMVLLEEGKEMVIVG